MRRWSRSSSTPVRREPRAARGAPSDEQGDRRPATSCRPIRVPTLILHGSEDHDRRRSQALATSPRASAARLVELPGAGSPRGRRRRTRSSDEIERFLTDVWEAGGWEEGEPDRVLATVLFTDIVGSTAKAAELGDRALARAARRAPRAHPPGARPLPRRGDRHRRRRLLRRFRRPGARDPLRLRDHRRVCASSGSRSAPASTPASARSWTARSAGSPCTSARGSPPQAQSRARCSSRARSRTSSPARESASTIAVRQSSRESPAMAAVRR